MDNSNANTTNTAKIKKREPTGIAFRMLILMIIFIALIFASIFLSFNFFMEGYVKNEMRTQLSNAVSEVTTQRYAVIQRDISQLPSGGNANSNASSSAAAFTLQPDYINLYNVMMQNVNSSNSKSEVNTIIYQQSNSKRVFPDAKYFSDDRYKLFFNFDEMDYIVSTVTVNGLTEKDKFYKASVKSGNYYLTTVDLGPYYGPYWQGLSMVFYISSEKYDQLMNNIYIMILIILVIAT
ncbi:MAG: hypothetical protein FWD71_21460, partial [Oscillospiraceae bacterium]|nr:hypothetical protein [Oscillospiraceae bacterium]